SERGVGHGHGVADCVTMSRGFDLGDQKALVGVAGQYAHSIADEGRHIDQARFGIEGIAQVRGYPAWVVAVATLPSRSAQQAGGAEDRAHRGLEEVVRLRAVANPLPERGDLLT